MWNTYRVFDDWGPEMRKQFGMQIMKMNKNTVSALHELTIWKRQQVHLQIKKGWRKRGKLCMWAARGTVHLKLLSGIINAMVPGVFLGNAEFQRNALYFWKIRFPGKKSVLWMSFSKANMEFFLIKGDVFKYIWSDTVVLFWRAAQRLPHGPACP